MREWSESQRDNATKHAPCVRRARGIDVAFDAVSKSSMKDHGLIVEADLAVVVITSTLC